MIVLCFGFLFQPPTPEPAGMVDPLIPFLAQIVTPAAHLHAFAFVLFCLFCFFFSGFVWFGLELLAFFLVFLVCFIHVFLYPWPPLPGPRWCFCFAFALLMEV